ncbi:hypothetical protein BX616_010240 [Lobosporangium transversale]|nr:hypothetical protein BX616_010240 [Lobosporangium transversale]
MNSESVNSLDNTLTEPSNTSAMQQPELASSPVSIRPIQLPRNAVGARNDGEDRSRARANTGEQNISPALAPRSFSESQQARQMNEYSPTPARSLAQVLHSAEEAENTRTDIGQCGYGEADRGQLSTSGVQFQTQNDNPSRRGHPESGIGSTGWMGTSIPESRFSGFEVVYDDGVRKQRTFSLTTQVDDEEESSSENDSGSASESSPLLNYQQTGPYSRKYTGHQQGDGGRRPVHGLEHAQGDPVSSWPYSDSLNDRHHSSSSGYNNYPFKCLFNSILAVWLYITQFTLSIPNRRILKASLAYLFACLISFTPFFLPYIGVSGHLAATSAVFFNPAKTLGRMVDAVVAGLCAIGFGFLVSIASMASAVWFNNRSLYIWGHVVTVVIFGGGSTFIIAYAKAYYNRPTVNVACTLSHIIILVTLTKEGALTLMEFNMTRVLAITTSMLLGVFISTAISIILWPESAHEKLRQDMGKSLSSFRLLLKLLTKTFLLEDDTTPFGSESVQKMIESQVKSFSALAKSLEEAQLEDPGKDIKKYEDCVKSLNTLAQYLNGLRSSCGLQYDMLKKDEQRKDGRTSVHPSSSSTDINAAFIRPQGEGEHGLGVGGHMSSFSLIGSLSLDQDQSASADLIEFLDHVGKPMKSLALTCKLTTKHLQDIFTDADVSRVSSAVPSRSRSRTIQSHLNQHGYDSAEAHSDSAFEGGNNSLHPELSRRYFKNNPSLQLMRCNLAKALDIFEAANSKALKRFYTHHYRRHSVTMRRSNGMTKPMSEPSLQGLMASSRAEAESTPQPNAMGDFVMEKAPVGEQIFLVYFFVFNLMEFSRELSHLVSCVERLVGGDDGLPLWIERNRQSLWRRIWFQLTGYPRRLRQQPTNRTIINDATYDPEIGLNSPPSNQSARLIHEPAVHGTPDYQQHGVYDSIGFRRRRKQRLFPKPNIHNKANTLQTPVPSTFSQRWSTRLWKFLHLFRSFQIKYAVKAAISATIILIPAFVDWTRPYFVQYRGEWALISMLIVMVPTVGGTNIVALYRILGTLVGCCVGVVVYLIFPAHEIMLPVCCFFFALPNFYLVLCSSYPRIGQVTLLAFNLVLIQTYNRRNGDGTVPPDDDDDDVLSGGHFSFSKFRSVPEAPKPEIPDDPSHVSTVWTIAFHRAVAVSIGVIIGVLVTSYVWPYEARVELRKGLSDLLLNISWLYNRLVSVYSINLDRVSIIPTEGPHQKDQSKFRELARRSTFQEMFQTSNQGQETALVESGEMHIEKMNKEFMAIELSLQLQLLGLYALLEETPNEPRLKGKFPVDTYKNMLGSCQNILDRFLSMRLVITKDEWVESARRDFIIPVNRERREMVGNVLLYFYTIASALRLKTPLPPYLPPANNARLRLIQKIRQLPVVQKKVVMAEDIDERYIFYYAYALVMEDIIRELERLGRWSQDLFGVITPAAEFEAWFTDTGEAPPALPPSYLPSSATREAPLSPYRDVDQPYQYPTVESYERAAASSQARHVRSLPQCQSGVANSSIPHRHPDETSGVIDSEAQIISDYRSLQNSINERDHIFNFDPQDPFRDQPVGPEYRVTNPGQGLEAMIPVLHSQSGSSTPLSSIASTLHAQQIQQAANKGDRVSHDLRASISHAASQYGTISKPSGESGGNMVGTRQKKVDTSSSQS